MDDLYAAIREHVPEILDEWDRITREHEPWSGLPAHERIDHLPQLVVDLAEASLDRTDSVEAHERVVFAAAEHGRQRRQQGFRDELITHEYYFIRRAIWHFIREVERDGRRRLDAIQNIDTSLFLVTRAGLLGYHRQELEQQGRWPDAIRQLVEQSPFLTGQRE